MSGQAPLLRVVKRRPLADRLRDVAAQIEAGDPQANLQHMNTLVDAAHELLTEFESAMGMEASG